MQILPITEHDTEKLRVFKEAEWKIADTEHYGNNFPSFENDSYTLLALEDDTIIGQVRLSVCQGIAKIESILVAKAHQGKGVGRELMAAAEARAVAAGAHKMSLETGLLWSAKGFYEKLGYTVRAVLPNDVAHQDFVLMDKMLIN